MRTSLFRQKKVCLGIFCACGYRLYYIKSIVPHVWISNLIKIGYYGIC